MLNTNHFYISLSYRLSQNIKKRPRLLKWYKKFCFAFLKPIDVKLTPIFINNRNHYTYLKELIDWLELNGFRNYYVIDNDSSYPPLLEYYRSSLKERVIYLHKNAGHLSMWREGLIKRVWNSFYVYTDSDVLPVLASSPFLLEDLYTALKKYDFAIKAGSAIKINDLPKCFALRDKVVEHEQWFWKNELEPTIFHAEVDTTFALYLPNYIWQVDHWDQHLRIAGNCEIRHQPWYQDTDHLTEEQQFYQSNASTQTHWTNFGAYFSKK
ncbi:MAG: glycosyltransferase family 2 protein [Flavobacterium sp.]|nr:MAG: glycosyltransferase family 2 protein [Flavobacterium sp.]